MSSKTKIVVLHMKELIYTGIFAALGILFIILLIIMFLPGKNNSGTSPDKSTNTESSGETTPQEPDTNNGPDSKPTASGSVYIPGVYTTELVLNDQIIDVEVIVDKDNINSVRLVNLNEAITTMYPLLQPTFDSICNQIYEKQTLDNITYNTESKYTSLVLLEAIKNSLDKASVTSGSETQPITDIP